MPVLPNVNQMLENRQHKLVHTQRRHLRSKVCTILASWRNDTLNESAFNCFRCSLRWVRHSGGGLPAQQHVYDKTYYMCTEALHFGNDGSRASGSFQSSLFFPLDSRCAVRLGMRTGPTAEEAEGRALGACLSLLPTAADWRRACRVWDSDLFEELSRTAAALDTALAVSLDLSLGDRDQRKGAAAAAAVVATISCALPAWSAAEVERGASAGDSGAATVLCIARETAPSLREALKRAMVAATETLSARVETEWQHRARDAALCCRAVADMREERGRGAGGLSSPLQTAALAASLPGGEAVWRRPETAVPCGWDVRAGPHADEVTVHLPSRQNPYTPLRWQATVPHIPPVRRRAVVVGRRHRDNNEPVQLRRTGTYSWPRGILPLVAVTLLAEKVSRLGHSAALRCPSLWQPPHTVEQFLYNVDAEREGGDGNSSTAALIAALTTTLASGRPSATLAPTLLRALLGLSTPPGARTADALRWAQEPSCLLPRSPLFLVLGQGGERPRWAGVPHPHPHLLPSVLEGCLAAFLAHDAVVRGDSTTRIGEVTVAVTSAALGLSSLPLYTHMCDDGSSCFSCALLRCVEERCVFASPQDEFASPTTPLPPRLPPPQRHEVAMVPDVLALLDEVRRARDLPSSSFPVITFTQQARHDPAQRFRELRAGLPGDVDVYTKVALRWEEAEPGWSVKAVSDPDLHHHSRNKSEVLSAAASAWSSSSCYALRDTGVPRGPLPLLLAVVLALHRRVSPTRGRSLPLLEVRSPTSRRGLDFLLYTWFGASPQIRTFDILSAAGWQQEAEGVASTSADGTVRHAVDKTMVRAMLFYDLLGQRVLFAETHDVRPGWAVARVERRSVELNLRLERSDEQRDRKRGEAAAVTAVALRPFRSISMMRAYERERQHLQQLCDVPSTDIPSLSFSSSRYEKASAHLLAGRCRPHLSELGALLAVLETVLELPSSTSIVFNFVPQLSNSSDAVEGVLSLQVAGRATEAVRVSSQSPPEQVRAEEKEEEERSASLVWLGVLPAAVHLAQQVLRQVLGDADAAALCHACEQCRTVLGRDGYPPYNASFYHAPRLLGELLQGIAGRYDCTYTHVRSIAEERRGEEELLAGAVRRPPPASAGPRTTFFASERDEVRGRPDWVAPLQLECRLTVASLAGCSSGSEEGNSTAPFLLGRGVGYSRREAWVAAARQALEHNFPTIHAQLESFRQLSTWRMDPVALQLLGAPYGLRLQWSASSNCCGLRILAATAAASPSVEVGGLTVTTTTAPDAETAFVDAVRSLEERLRHARQGLRKEEKEEEKEKEGAIAAETAAPLLYAAWTPESHYTKSLWHGLCGGLSASMGGSRVRLYFEVATQQSHKSDTNHTTRTAGTAVVPPFAAVHVVQHLVLPHPRDGVFRPVRRPLLTLTWAEVADYLGGEPGATQRPAALLLRAVPAALHALFTGSLPAPPLPAELQQLLHLHAREVARTCRRSRHLSPLQQAHAVLTACTGCRADVTVVAADQTAAGWKAEAWLELPCYVDTQADARWERVLVAVHTGHTSDRAVTALCRELVAEAERLNALLASFSQNANTV